MALGADGWMNDFAEWLPTDGVTAAGPSLDRHNRYPVLWQEAAREAIDGVNDGKERLFFGRSGWFGTPALADVIWAGDQRTDFQPDDGLPTILPIGIGLGLVGVSTYGHDIAGYQSATNEVPAKRLFFRWTSLGLLLRPGRGFPAALPGLHGRRHDGQPAVVDFQRQESWQGELSRPRARASGPAAILRSTHRNANSYAGGASHWPPVSSKPRPSSLRSRYGEDPGPAVVGVDDRLDRAPPARPGRGTPGIVRGRPPPATSRTGRGCRIVSLRMLQSVISQAVVE